jgi:VanZ family protein
VEIIGADKIVHILIYGLLAVLCYLSAAHQSKYPALFKNAILFTIIFCSLYGISDELHQSFVPNRDCEFWDWAADFAGIILASVLIKYYLSRNMKIFKKNI